MAGNPRYTKEVSKEELQEFFNKFVRKNNEVADNIGDALLNLVECIGASKVMKDLDKYDFYYENVLLKEDVEELKKLGNQKYFYDDFGLLGIQQIKGRTFLGVLGGSDYGVPLYFILYQDNKNTLRGYIPSKGNALNPYINYPFGEEIDMDEKFAKDKGFNTISEMEEKCYKFLDEELLIEDICERLQTK